MFGSSPFLQATDYQAPADLTFAQSYTISSTSLDMALSAAAVQHLSATGGNQFRITLPQNCFTNHNGARVGRGWVMV